MKNHQLPRVDLLNSTPYLSSSDAGHYQENWLGQFGRVPSSGADGHPSPFQHQAPSPEKIFALDVCQSPVRINNHPPDFSKTPGSRKYSSCATVTTEAASLSRGLPLYSSMPSSMNPPLPRHWTPPTPGPSVWDCGALATQSHRLPAPLAYCGMSRPFPPPIGHRPILGNRHKDDSLPSTQPCEPAPPVMSLGQLHPANRPASKGPLRPILGSQPYQSHSNNSTIPLHQSTAGAASGVALAITNLDYNITNNEWQKILYQTLQPHVQILGIHLHTQPDGSSMALVYVPTQDDARCAISNCHRKKIGYKRIQVAIHTPESPDLAHKVRLEVVSILAQVVGNTLPLFKFIEIYEKRYHRGITVSELYHMKDTVEIKEHSGKGRMVCLQSTLALNSAGCRIAGRLPVATELPIEPYCTIHCTASEYTLLSESGMLPYVKVRLKLFRDRTEELIKRHSGELPLLSFNQCYEDLFEKLTVTVDGGVPLEHLITCIPSAQVRSNPAGVKTVVWQEGRSASPTGSAGGEICSDSGRGSQSLSQQLSQFSREVVDLLKRMPACQMSFSKFIPSYHHHFGRQCRVADFGFTKLQELFDAIPHVLQILGTGSQRVLYLTHRIHMRRFTADMCRVLKAQPEKQCSIDDFPELYSEVIGVDLVMSNFGVCFLKDMLLELNGPECPVVIDDQLDTISIPRKDQTAEEMERTKQFSYEVIDLLKNCPQCSMPFNKFIPAYHHHYGRQCRVADFGFSKLIELFEAIPDVVTVTEQGEERQLSLTKAELYRVLSEQMLSLLKSCPSEGVEIHDLNPIYQKLYGHSIHIEEFGVESLENLVAKIPHVAHIEKRPDGNYITMNDRSAVEQLARNVLELLMEKSDGEMRLSSFIERYQLRYNSHPNLVKIKHELYPALMIREDECSGVIYLHSLLSTARRIKVLLQMNQGKLTLLTFEMAYRQNFGMGLDTKKCGFPGISVMLQIMDFMVSVRGRGARQAILLRQDYLSRLSHQLAYKIGICTEVLKYKETENDNSKDSRGALNSDSGISGDTPNPHNETILAGSPDIVSSRSHYHAASYDSSLVYAPSDLSPRRRHSCQSSELFSPDAIGTMSSELENASKLLASAPVMRDRRMSTSLLLKHHSAASAVSSTPVADGSRNVHLAPTLDKGG